jgi:CubicO group peptidase (beta-lactamase class C family)
MLPYTEVLFPPGSRWSYSNPGIIFLGRVIEAVSGEEWEVYVEKNILRPLEMHRSYFDFTPYHLLPFRSNNYTVVDGVPQANGLDFNTGITVSNGGLNSPLGDMAKYLSFLTDSGTEADREAYRGVLARESLEEMWVEEVPIQETAELRESMALSFFLEEFRGVRYVGHTGSQKAFFSFVYVHPESGTAAIAAFNSNGLQVGGPARPDTRSILNHLREEFFSEVFPLFL